MGNCYTPPWLTQMEDPTSPAWKPCLGSFTTILTFHAPRPDNFLQTSIGGPTNFPNQPSEEAFQQRTRSMISLLSQTQAQAQVSGSSSENDGERGSSFPGGTQTGETSGGPRLWASSSSREPSRFSTQPTKKSTLGSMATTKGSLMAGREAAAEILASTRFSNVLQNSRETQVSSYTRDTSEAPEILQMAHLGASIHQTPFYSPPSTSRMNSNPSSQTTMILQMVANSRMANLTQRHEPYPNRSRAQRDKPIAGGKMITSTALPDISTKQKPRHNGTNFGHDQLR